MVSRSVLYIIRSFSRLFWICCLVLGVILTGCQITGCVLLYLGRHVVIQIDTTPDVTVPFPVVTLCNFNVFRLVNDSVYMMSYSLVWSDCVVGCAGGGGGGVGGRV